MNVEQDPTTVTWRPHVQPVGQVPRPGTGVLEPVTQTSLKHNQPPSTPIGTGHNASAKPFAGPTLVHKQFNSPINLYSNKNIAETIKAHSEILAPGVVGINFMKADAPVNKESAVYKAILEEEAAKSQPRGGAPFGSHYQQPMHSYSAQGGPPPGATSSAPFSPQASSIREDTLRGASPTLQSHSFRRLQQVLGDSDEPCATRHVEAPVASPAGLGPNQTVETNICSECGRLIVGIFCKIKDRKLHEECFKCSTCGSSLKNQGYFNINEKLYCDIHAQQAARASSQQSRVIQPNSTTIRPQNKPLSPSIGICSPTPAFTPMNSASSPFTANKPTSPVISNWQQNDVNRVTSPLQTNSAANSNLSSSIFKNYNSNLYQSVPTPFPGPGSSSFKPNANSVTAPKFQWPNTVSTYNDQVVNTGDGLAKIHTETHQSSYSSGPVYSGNTTSNSYTNSYSTSQQVQQLSSKLDGTSLHDSNKIPPRTLPKPAVPTTASWPKPSMPLGGVSTTNQTQSYRQQQTISNTSGIGGSFTDSRPAPRRGRGQLQTLEQGGRQPVCASGICGQAIRGPFIAALGRTWCPEHFVCAHGACRRPLQDCGFVEEKGHLYCESCFELHFAPTCAKCGQRIKGDCLIALDKQYHPQCFVCSYCKKVFANTSFYLEDGLPYCEQDWNELFTTKCIACAMPIEAGDRWVEALNNNYHSQCFRCTVCTRNLEGESFYAKGGKPYCKAH